jgi:RNase P/RNase MRP subunit p30
MSLEIASSPTLVETMNSAPIKVVRAATKAGRIAKVVRAVVPGRSVTRLAVSRTTRVVKVVVIAPGGLAVVRVAIRRNPGTVDRVAAAVVGVSRNVLKTPT